MLKIHFQRFPSINFVYFHSFFSVSWKIMYEEIVKFKMYSTPENTLPAIITHRLNSNQIHSCFYVDDLYMTCIPYLAKKNIVHTSDAYQFQYIWNKLTSLQYIAKDFREYCKNKAIKCVKLFFTFFCVRIF